MTGTPIPGAIEVLLKKAAVDPAFRGLFLSGPLDAARSIGLDLAPAERTVLSAIPADQLERTAERMEVPEEQRRVFRGRAAAAMLAIVAGTAFLGCGGAGPEPEDVSVNEPSEWETLVIYVGARVYPMDPADLPDEEE